MRKNLSLLLLLILVLSCSSVQKNKVSMQKLIQGIEGTVIKLVGNQMPMIDAPKLQPIPVALTVCIYDSTNLKDVNMPRHMSFFSEIRTKLITTVQSDITGYFSVALPEGKYSLFVKVKGKFYSNLFDEKNNIFLVTVEKNKLTKVEIKVSNEAVF